MIKIAVKTYYLEQKEPTFDNSLTLPEFFTIKSWEKPIAPKEYLKNYKKIGQKWGWTGRLLMSEQELEELLNSEKSKVVRLFYQSEIIGLLEYDLSNSSQPEIVYFGLAEEFIGKGLGKLLLHWGIKQAWQSPIERLWLHTCEYDHPSALPFYQKNGFKIYKEQIDYEYYDKDFLDKNKS